VLNQAERFPDREHAIDARLEEAGLLVPPPSDDDLAEGEALAVLESDVASWLAGLTRPLDLAEAVLEGRK
jgi:hypothetical protein